MVFPKPWVKNSHDFSCFFSFLHQFIDLEKNMWYLVQSTKLKYKLCKSQHYLYDK